MFYKRISQVKQANKANGYYFFHPKTMKQWRTRIESSIYTNNCFITSESNGYNKKRFFTIRQVKDFEGRIHTVKFGIKTIETAREIARAQKPYHLQEGENDVCNN